MTPVREQAIEAAFEAMLRVDGRVSDNALAAVVDAIEPIIRADERHKALMVCDCGCGAQENDAVEAEVRERIAQDIEAQAADEGLFLAAIKAFEIAACIARGGDR